MWWPFRKKPKKAAAQISNLSNYCIKYASDMLGEKGLISLYMGGSYGTDDQLPNSDLDLFGIVDSKFDMDFEKALNSEFHAQQKNLFGGLSVKFHAIPIGILLGKNVKDKGMLEYYVPERFVKKFEFYEHVWGRKYRSDNFNIDPISHYKEADLVITQLNKSLEDVRNKTNNFPRQDFPKHVIELCRIEAENGGFEYTPSYEKLEAYMSDKPKHIVHDALKLRRNPSSHSIDMVPFLAQVEEYLKDMEIAIVKW